jgi:hypothetical protein
MITPDHAYTAKKAEESTESKNFHHTTTIDTRERNHVLTVKDFEAGNKPA